MPEYASNVPSPGAAGPPSEPVRRQLRGREAAVARNLEASISIPTASTLRTFEVSALTGWRRRSAEAGVRVSVAGVIAAAVARTAQYDVPSIRRRIAKDGETHAVIDDGMVNLGFAVDVEGRNGHSILVPVIRDAGRLSLVDLMERMQRLSEACRAGTVAVTDLQGANLLLTSTGRFGSTTGVPLLPPGPGAIIAAGSIKVPAGLERLAESLPVDPVLTLASTYDHRIIQGADSGEFLAAVEARLRSPEFFQELERELAPVSGEAGSVTTADRPGSGVRVVEFDSWSSARSARIEPVRALGREDSLPEGVEIEFVHLADPERRAWFTKLLETRAEGVAPERRCTAWRLAADIDVFESFLQTQFLGQKTLSVEGLESSVIALAEIAGLAAHRGGTDVMIGMAHRGRLSIMAHLLRWPAEQILAEFLPTARAPLGAAGDVRQHLGGEGCFTDASGDTISITLEQNPSHLEFVSPVALGAARARQDRIVASGADRAEAHRRILPVLLHGDAAFTGQGVVYETFNLQGLDPYTVGGAVHIVQNNHLGFTATPSQLRTTAWPSDVVRGFDVPVIHTDAEDIDANLIAARIALAYRDTFGSDIVVHVQGYRRHGHNESDEPRYTQPVYYAQVDAHRPVHEGYANRLLKEGLLDAQQIAQAREETQLRLADGLARAKSASFDRDSSLPAATPKAVPLAGTASPAQLLDVLDRAEGDRDDIALHPKLHRQFVKRRHQRSQDQLVDWGQAELLALALLNQAGVPIRLTGEDVERGTFSHRHLVVHDANDGSKHLRLPLNGAPFLIANTPLTEVATVAFEYGYGRTSPGSLQVWEAQFGDFVNVAQVIFDQFVMTGRDKWGRDGRLVLLLPHGWEGAGPEHSSARLERFLQLAARDNCRILVPTTASQYFAALVEAGSSPTAQPWVILTPKSLLRAHSSKSPVQELARGRLNATLASGSDSKTARRLVMCSGKVAVEAESHIGEDVRLVRVEQLYPFPMEEIRAEVAAAPMLEEVVWLQEEPENMGAWRFVSHQLMRAGLDLPAFGYVGRPEGTSPAEGYQADHRDEQQRLLTATGRRGHADLWLAGGRQ